jgi:hypothetical protein
MTQRVMTAITLAAMVASSLPSSAQPQTTSKPTFRTVAQCIAAYDRERALVMEANAKLKKARVLSAEEDAAIADQNRHSERANQIDQVCNEMKRNERPLADQVKELTGVIDGLGPVGGSVRTPVAGAVRQHNLTKAGDKMEQLGGTLDQALADFRASSGSGAGAAPGAPPLLRSNPDPALGAKAAQSLRADLDQWKAAEAERQRLAAIEAARQRRIRAEQERIALAQAAEARAIEAAQEEERQSRRSSIWGTLGTIAGIGIGVAAARSGRTVNPSALQNYATAQALSNAHSASRSSSAGRGSGDLDTQCPGLMNRLAAIPQQQVTGVCQGLNAELAFSRRYESVLLTCSHPQALSSLREVRATIASTEDAKRSSGCS